MGQTASTSETKDEAFRDDSFGRLCFFIFMESLKRFVLVSMTTVSELGVGDGSWRDPTRIGSNPDLFSAMQDGQNDFLKIPAGAARTEAAALAARCVTPSVKQRWSESLSDAEFIPES